MEVAVAADAHMDTTQSLLASSSGAASAFGNLPLVAAFLAFAIAQALKVLTTWYASLLSVAVLGLCSFSLSCMHNEAKKA